jgi:hypothetical protein
MTSETPRSIPKLDIKLKGQENFAEWALSVEMFLSMHTITIGYTIWDIVNGTYPYPEEKFSIKEKEAESSVTKGSPRDKIREWTQANFFAILTMRKNCEEAVLSKFGMKRTAKEVWDTLKSLYEGKTVTDYGTLLCSISKLTNNDRESTIEDHISEYERRWNYFSSILATGESRKDDDGVGVALQQLTRSDQAKAQRAHVVHSDSPTYEEAMEGPYRKEFLEAMEKERQQLQEYNVYDEVSATDIPKHEKIIDTKWVLLIKRKVDGTIEKFKARKVARGYVQESKKHYDQTFAQVARPETWKILLLLALREGWVMEQWDVEGAFLNADLHHDIYVQDTTPDGRKKTWKLRKALYGLKQAGHEWRKMLKRLLEQADLKQTVSNEGCYTKRGVRLASHVDDILATADSKQKLDTIRRSLKKTVKIENRGAPEKFLGIALTLQPESVSLTQEMYIENLATEYNINHRVTSPTTTSPTCSLEKPMDNEPRCNQTIYRALVGTLLHISRFMRPDISITVSLLGRRVEDPSQRNLEAARRVLQYLWSTKSVKHILAKTSTKVDAEIWADASYGGEGSRSQTGALVTVAGQPINWYSRRQDVVALSVTEAEYIAACEGAKDAAWIRQRLPELGQ